MSDWPPEAWAGLIVISAPVVAIFLGKLAGKIADKLLKLKTLVIMAGVAGLATLFAIAYMGR